MYKLRTITKETGAVFIRASYKVGQRVAYGDYKGTIVAAHGNAIEVKFNPGTRHPTRHVMDGQFVSVHRLMFYCRSARRLVRETDALKLIA